MWSLPEGAAGITRTRHPEPADVALIVEVASSSLSEDRELAGIYAAGGIVSYWIINLLDRQVEVYTDPGPSRYGSRQILKPGQDVSVVVAGNSLGRIAVADVLPRRP